MASFTMAPINPLPQQQQQQTQQPQQPVCQCRRRTYIQSSTHALTSSSSNLSLTTDQSLPVRLSPPSLMSLPFSSHAYNLRSSSSSRNAESNHACISSLTPSTDAYIPTFDYPCTPSLSPPFSFTTDPCDTYGDVIFTQKDTLNQSQQTALGVNLNQPVYNSNYNDSNSFEQWSRFYRSNNNFNPIQSLLNSDISTKNSALPESTHVPDNGQSISNAIDNTVYQQLQGFNFKNHLMNKTQHIMSSSPQTPRDGAAILSSFGPTSTFGGAGMNKSLADFDFDMLAASFLNDQVAAFDTLSTQPPAAQNNSDNFFASLPLVDSPTFGNNNNPSNSPPLQNAFRNFSLASAISIPHQPMSTRNNSTSSLSSESATLASPAFDASINFPFNFNNSVAGSGALLYNSPNFSGVETPALIPDDGTDLAASLTTSPMWGQLGLGSISLFPQQHPQKAPTQEKTNITPLQHLPSLPTISPTELSLPLPTPTAYTSAFNDQVEPASCSALNKANKKRVRESPAFGDEDDEDENDLVEQQQSLKKRRRSTASSTPAAAGHFNGTRYTSNAPLSLDAPTQTRTYYGPESKTSKRAIPAAAARKVAAIKAQAEMLKRVRRSVSIVDPKEQDANADEEEDEIEGEFKEAIDLSIEAKRRQNTVAARRSRARKAEHLTGLENTIKELTERVSLLENEKMVWMMRALASGWSENTRSA